MRQCPIWGCGKPIPPELFACRAHWIRLPRRLRSIIHASYGAWKARKLSGPDLKAIQGVILSWLEDLPVNVEDEEVLINFLRSRL